MLAPCFDAKSHWIYGERGGSVVECRTPEREVRGSRPTSAVLCPWARHFTPRKYWLITQEAMAPSRHDWKIVDWDVKPQHNQHWIYNKNNIFWAIETVSNLPRLMWGILVDTLRFGSVYLWTSNTGFRYRKNMNWYAAVGQTQIKLLLIRVYTVCNSSASFGCITLRKSHTVQLLGWLQQFCGCPNFRNITVGCDYYYDQLNDPILCQIYSNTWNGAHWVGKDQSFLMDSEDWTASAFHTRLHVQADLIFLVHFAVTWLYYSVQGSQTWWKWQFKVYQPLLVFFQRKWWTVKFLNIRPPVKITEKKLSWKLTNVDFS